MTTPLSDDSVTRETARVRIGDVASAAFQDSLCAFSNTARRASFLERGRSSMPRPKTKRVATAALIGGASAFVATLLAPVAWARWGPQPESGRERPSEPGELALEVIIPAYLEAGVIADTLSRIRRQLRYWPGQASIAVIASDEMTQTASESSDRVVLCDPRGKPFATNLGVATSTADVIVLTDANCQLSPENWPELLWDDLKTADLVSGAKREVGGRESAYWAYERLMHPADELTDSLSVVGEFLAMRRTDFRDVPTTAKLDDLWMGLSFVERGLRVCVDPRIKTVEDQPAFRDQMERRVRISAGFYSEAIPRAGTLMRTSVGVAYLLHKPLRMTVGVAGFWVAVAGATLTRPPLTAVVVPAAIAGAVHQYARGTIASPALRAVSAATTMQIVPVLGAARAIRARWSAASEGWRKTPR